MGQLHIQLLHRMSLADFHARAVVKILVNHGQRFEVFFDGRSLGFSSEDEPVRHAHRREVNNALYAMQADSPDFIALGAVMPSKEALAAHPELEKRMPIEFRAAMAGLPWTADHNAAAEREGWALFDADGELQVQRLDEEGILASDDEAFDLVMKGREPHHFAIRGHIYDKSPAEWARIVKHAAGERTAAPAAPKDGFDQLADAEFESYEFGGDCSVVGHDGWERVSRGDSAEFSKIVYVRFSDDPAEADSTKLTFNVKFQGNQIEDVYALEHRHGNEIGQRGRPVDGGKVERPRA